MLGPAYPPAEGAVHPLQLLLVSAAGEEVVMDDLVAKRQQIDVDERARLGSIAN